MAPLQQGVPFKAPAFEKASSSSFKSVTRKALSPALQMAPVFRIRPHPFHPLLALAGQHRLVVVQIQGDAIGLVQKYDDENVPTLP